MDTQKIRHKYLTVWLIIMLIFNSLASLSNICNSLTIREINPNVPFWIFPTLTLISILNIVFVIALFRWEKWGFWGLVAIFTLSFIVNLLIGVDFVFTFLGISGLVILFGALRIGKEYSGWSQLE